MRWSREEDARLEALFRAGTPRSEIAQQLDRHDGAITRRLEKLGLVAAAERPPSRTRRRGQQTESPSADPAGETVTSPDAPVVPGWDLFRDRLTEDQTTT